MFANQVYEMILGADLQVFIKYSEKIQSQERVMTKELKEINFLVSLCAKKWNDLNSS